MPHTLLPIEIQDRLIRASQTSQVHLVIQTIQAEYPELFHTEKSLLNRGFLNQPRGSHSGTYLIPAPANLYPPQISIEELI